MGSSDELIQDYRVTTSVYEGPLDLLLQLIEKAELDITTVALAQITDQFIEYLHQMPECRAEDVSAFISVASRLMQIKSEALLPRPPVRGPNEVDPGEELTRQLIVYKRFKHIAEMLGTVYAEKHAFLRWAPLPKNDPQIDLKGITIGDLMLVAKYVLSKEDQLPSLSSVVAPPKITIREKIAWIVDYLRKNRSGVFTHLLKDRSRRIEIVVTFLALLELVKRDIIQVNQKDLYGEIVLEPSTFWEEDLSFELEFGE